MSSEEGTENTTRPGARATPRDDQNRLRHFLRTGDKHMELNPHFCLAEIVGWGGKVLAAKLSSQDPGDRRATAVPGRGSVTRQFGVGKEGTPNFTFLSRVGYRDLGERTLVRIPACGGLLLVFPGFPSVGSRASGV